MSIQNHTQNNVNHQHFWFVSSHTLQTNCYKNNKNISNQTEYSLSYAFKSENIYTLLYIETLKYTI